MPTHNIYVSTDEADWIDDKTTDWDESRSGVIRRCIRATMAQEDTAPNGGLTPDNARSIAAELKEVADHIEQEADA